MRVSQRAPGLRRSASREQGQTLLLVAISLTALLGLAALAIDVTNLYVARSEAQKAADAAALAGAKTFVSTGFTSGGLGNWTDGGVQATVCNGNNGYADLQAQAAAAQNTVAGVAPSTATMTTACNFANPQDPQITVTITRGGLPTFLGRIWAAVAPTATATAKAEAFNPSGQTNNNISVSNVKPWLVANCDPTIGNTPPALNCGGKAHLLDPANNYAIMNNGSFIGQTIQLWQLLPGSIPVSSLGLLGSFYLVQPGSPAVSCPSTSSSTQCSAVDPTASNLFEWIACSNTFTLQCGQTITVDGSLLPQDWYTPAMCLTHANNYNAGQGQDIFVGTNPVTMTGGSNNPLTSYQGTADISRSDSVVTVPIWDGAVVCVAGVTCTPTVVGFMQIGIQQVNPTSPLLPSPLNAGQSISGVILNVSGCGGARGGGVIAGNNNSPIPVRLVQ